MPRQQLLVALAAGLLMVLSSINLLHKYGPSGFSQHIWNWSTSQHATALRNSTQYLLGVGKADITGPVVEIGFMGYADPNQLGSGVRQRLYSRAFIIGSLDSPDDRFVYLVLDTQSGDTAVRHGILEALEGLGPDYSMYGQQNVAVTGTHSHSGPGAWLNYLLPQITTKGFHKPSYYAIVDGAVESIKRAHQSLAPGYLTIGVTEIEDANINRSPYAYLANPVEERSRYKHDVDKNLTLLRFSHAIDGGEIKDVGILTWFATHGTSMHGNNTLVTGDNKGVAAWMFESSIEDPDFVAGFSQANVGDTSPNTLGAYCETGDHAGEQCDFKTSLCGNKTQPCHGRGPYFGRDDGGTASTFEIGRRQFKGARALFDDHSAFTPVDGDIIRSVHKFVDLSNHQFPVADGSIGRTCPAALGYSFAAGTSDGPGAFDFKQAQPGDPHANPLWSLIGNRVHKPNDSQIECHGDKVILLDVGESDNPYAWSPNIVDIQVLRVGQLFIIVSPGEATTMAGRRWREAVQSSATDVLPDLNSDDAPMAVLGGPANSYTHYITTTEEYSIQRYEGASTLYGPYTLDAYINLTLSNLHHLDISSKHHPRLTYGPQPPILINQSLSFITPVIVDRAPLFKAFGDLQTDTLQTPYKPGDTISATFVGANPRNNLRLGGTFAAVEKFDFRAQAWTQIRSDADWSLVFEWKRTSTLAGTSEVTVSWETKWETGQWRTGNTLLNEDTHVDLRPRNDALEGLYRLRCYGDSKALGGVITSFEGTSSTFSIR